MRAFFSIQNNVDVLPSHNYAYSQINLKSIIAFTSCAALAMLLGGNTQQDVAIHIGFHKSTIIRLV